MNRLGGVKQIHIKILILKHFYYAYHLFDNLMNKISFLSWYGMECFVYQKVSKYTLFGLYMKVISF